MLRIVTLMLLASLTAAGQTKKITPLTTQEASDWKAANQGVSDTEKILSRQQKEKDTLEAAILAAHKSTRKPTACGTTDIVDSYILVESGGCLTYWPGGTPGGTPGGSIQISPYHDNMMGTWQ